MKPVHSLRYCLMLLLLLTSAIGTASDAMKREADRAAGKWLALIDGGFYQASWERSATLFRQQVSADAWKHAVANARLPLGNMHKRKLVSALYTTSLPGAPDGDYVVLQYQTEFSNKKSAIETVTPMLDQGQWRVSGYYVR